MTILNIHYETYVIFSNIWLISYLHKYKCSHTTNDTLIYAYANTQAHTSVHDCIGTLIKQEPVSRIHVHPLDAS